MSLSRVLARHPLPWRVEVNPFGPPPDGADNVFIVDATGTAVCIISKHPVWTSLEPGRVQTAEALVALVNAQGEQKAEGDSGGQ